MVRAFDTGAEKGMGSDRLVSTGEVGFSAVSFAALGGAVSPPDSKA